MVLLWGPRGVRFPTSEVALYHKRHTRAAEGCESRLADSTEEKAEDEAEAEEESQVRCDAPRFLHP